MRLLNLSVRLALLVGAVGCGRAAWADSPGAPALPSTTANYVKYAVTDLPTHFKVGALASMDNTPSGNQITNAGATLGRVLFYDERLSHSDGTSCASCHQQQTGFSDPDQLSTGFAGKLTGRHSMALVNSAYYARKRFFWDERAETLEKQVLIPIENHIEMGSTLSDLAVELSQTAYYPTLFTNAFETTDITPDLISKALSQFVRSMKSYNSKFDRAVKTGTPGNPNYSEYSSEELMGAELFHGAGRCNQCHVTAAQVADTPHNIGLDATITDNGATLGKFKTPSLRNVEVRGRYMHDGRFDSLEQVVEFYNSRIQYSEFLDVKLVDGDHALRLDLTQVQKDALVAFLKTLTDETILTSNLFTDPFVFLAGDVNDDGEVDADDFAAWSASYGSVGDAGDADDDGDTDAFDLLAWQRNAGRSWLDLTIPSGPASAVPEPVSLAQFALCGLLAAAAARRRMRARALWF